MIFGTYFGNVEVSVELNGKRLLEGQNFNQQNNVAAHARIAVHGRPTELTLVAKVNPGKGKMAIATCNETPISIGADSKFHFTTAVEWKNGNPHTRRRGNDNFDVILLDKEDGQFVNLQFGLVTRQGHFFLTAQQIWKGTVVRTRKEGKLVWDFVPSAKIHAYPNGTYQGVWSVVADSVLAEAMEAGTSDQKSRALTATWEPPVLAEQPNAGGWYEGSPLYFNLVTGTGKIRNAKGVDFFVHFSDILDGDMVPSLNPMTKVLFKPAGQNKAILVKQL